METDDKRTYVNLNDETNLVLSMLQLSSQTSGALPSKVEFYDSLTKLNIEPTDDLLKEVRKNFPSIQI